jgi:hypothetical protein
MRKLNSPKLTVRMSTLVYVSMQGSTKNIPGPFAPPGTNLPKRNITARLQLKLN